MEPQGRDALQVLEQRRVQLEHEIEVIESSLAYWRSSETDYELVKEAVEEVDKDNNDSEFKDRVWYQLKELRGLQALKSDDIESLIRDKNRGSRTREQILNLIKHRIDYVQSNVESITKRKNAVENKLRGVEVLIQPDMVDEDGLPLIEITEELDEEGNVISSSTSDPNKDASTLFQDFESKGLTGDDKITEPPTKTNDSASTSTSTTSTSSSSQSMALSSRAATAEAAARAKADELAATLDDDEDESEYQHQNPAQSKPTESMQMSVATLLNSIADIDESKSTDLGPGLKMKDSSHFKSVPKDLLRRGHFDTEPVIPEGESAEDAALRKQMLEYSPYEVGAVVASMDFDDDDDDDDEDYDDEEEDGDDEDEFGRSTKSVLTDEYKQQMLELERQLNAKNLGPQPGLISPTGSEDEHTDNIEPVRELSLAPPPAAAPAESSLADPAQKKEKKSGKAKGVRFAEEVDVSSRKRPAANLAKAAQQNSGFDTEDIPAVNPMREDIVERRPQAKLSVSPEVQKRKVSRFKAAREPKEAPSGSNLSAASKLQPITDDHARNFAGPLLSTTTDAPKYTPEGPVGKTHADVLERPQSEIRAPEPGDDDILTKQALAAEYYRQRNNKIYQQGGFQADDPAEIPLDENGEEIRPKVSRFKAARVGKPGK